MGRRVGPRTAWLTPLGNEKSTCWPKMVPTGWILGAILGPKSVKIDEKNDAEKRLKNEAKII